MNYFEFGNCKKYIAPKEYHVGIKPGPWKVGKTSPTDLVTLVLDMTELWAHGSPPENCDPQYIIEYNIIIYIYWYIFLKACYYYYYYYVCICSKLISMVKWENHLINGEMIEHTRSHTDIYIHIHAYYIQKSKTY